MIIPVMGDHGSFVKVEFLVMKVFITTRIATNLGHNQDLSKSGDSDDMKMGMM